MNRKDLIERTFEILKANKIRKPVAAEKHVFVISDDKGNKKEFVAKKTERTLAYSRGDVESIIGACIDAIYESISKGEPVAISGLGELEVSYRKARHTRRFDTKERIEIPGHYIPKFHFGKKLAMCAKIYEMSLGEKGPVSEDEPEENSNQ